MLRPTHQPCLSNSTANISDKTYESRDRDLPASQSYPSDIRSQTSLPYASSMPPLEMRRDNSSGLQPPRIIDLIDAPDSKTARLPKNLNRSRQAAEKAVAAFKQQNAPSELQGSYSDTMAEASDDPSSSVERGHTVARRAMNLAAALDGRPLPFSISDSLEERARRVQEPGSIRAAREGLPERIASDPRVLRATRSVDIVCPPKPTSREIDVPLTIVRHLGGDPRPSRMDGQRFSVILDACSTRNSSLDGNEADRLPEDWTGLENVSHLRKLRWWLQPERRTHEGTEDEPEMKHERGLGSSLKGRSRSLDFWRRGGSGKDDTNGSPRTGEHRREQAEKAVNKLPKEPSLTRWFSLSGVRIWRRETWGVAPPIAMNRRQSKRAHRGRVEGENLMGGWG